MSWKCIVTAGKGTLLGGVKKHEVTPCKAKQDAWRLAVIIIEQNLQTGRDIEAVKVIETKTKETDIETIEID